MADETAVVAAVRRDLARMEALLPGLATSARAETALALAKAMDSDSSATSKSMCAKALDDILTKLEEISAKAPAADKLDEIGARRQQRRSRAS